MPETKTNYERYLDSKVKAIVGAVDRGEIVSKVGGLTPEEKKQVALKAMQVEIDRGNTSSRLFLIADALEILNDEEVDAKIVETFIKELNVIITHNIDVKAKIDQCLSDLAQVNYDYAQVHFFHNTIVDNLLRKRDL